MQCGLLAACVGGLSFIILSAAPCFLHGQVMLQWAVPAAAGSADADTNWEPSPGQLEEIKKVGKRFHEGRPRRSGSRVFYTAHGS